LDPQLRHLRREVSATSRENELLSFFIAHRLGDGEDLESLEGAGVDMFGDGDVVPSRLTQTQLLDVAKGCVEDIKAESILAKEKSLGALSTLHVVVTQAGLRLEGLKAQTREFNSTVVVRGKNQRTGTVTAEAVVKFYEDSLRKRRQWMEKLAWKTGVLQKRLEGLRGKGGNSSSDSTSSELLRYIIFHQLRIEHSQLTAKLAETSKKLLKLKMVSGFTSDLVTQLKGSCSRCMSSTFFCFVFFVHAF
jgi:hypothetical protein